MQSTFIQNCLGVIMTTTVGPAVAFGNSRKTL